MAKEEEEEEESNKSELMVFDTLCVFKILAIERVRNEDWVNYSSNGK